MESHQISLYIYYRIIFNRNYSVSSYLSHRIVISASCRIQSYLLTMVICCAAFSCNVSIFSVGLHRYIVGIESYTNISARTHVYQIGESWHDVRISSRSNRQFYLDNLIRTHFIVSKRPMTSWKNRVTWNMSILILPYQSSTNCIRTYRLVSPLIQPLKL